jgi:uncharacterized membrane protein YuzA (DUF378 family)
MNMIVKILVIIGGINWGILGLGMLLGKMDAWNVVHLLLGSIPVLEGIIYLLVGISAVAMIFGCKCEKCKDSCCGVEEKKEEVKM